MGEMDSRIEDAVAPLLAALHKIAFENGGHGNPVDWSEWATQVAREALAEYDIGNLDSHELED